MNVESPNFVRFGRATCILAFVSLLFFAPCFLSTRAQMRPTVKLDSPGQPVPAQAQIQTQGQPQDEDSQVQLVQPSGPGHTAPPVTITLQDALKRARENDAGFRAAVNDAKSVREDRLQARNAILPSVSYRSEALLTQGNGGRTDVGRFVTNDGVHVYRSWGILHEDLSPENYMGTGYRRAAAAEALASAKAEIAKRGLVVAVTHAYYALVTAQRKYATAQLALKTAEHFREITRDAERVGQVAHTDVIQADIQYEQEKQSFDDASLAMESARLDLAVFLSPALNENFTVVDDLDSPAAVPDFAEAEKMAEHENPDLRVAFEQLHEANLDVTAAKGAFLPAFYTDSIYGIEANSYALHSANVEFPNVGPLPNLGYFITVGVNVPLWDWGTLRSKLHQAEYKRDQARVELSQAQRVLVTDLYRSYNETLVARSAVEESRHAAGLAAENLRLITLRYQAGASSSLEVVSAENTLTQSRNAFDDAQLRYRVALATLQTVTGTF
ncbi:MAG TPA: TolC family protein [Candidatus Limnocylindrales bacterium]|nr:TolC family protein [Candidatus Limnocylindrales bacterium]